MTYPFPLFIWFLLLALCVSPVWSATPKITVKGVNAEQERNVRAHLSLSELSCKADDWRLTAMRERAAEEIRRALQALGYYQPQTSIGKLTLGATCWSLTISIKPGKPVTISKVDLRVTGEAAGEKAFTGFIAKQPVKRGAVLRHDAYESTKSKLLSLAAAHGYHDAVFSDKRLLIDPESATAKVHLVLDSGPLYRIGEVRFQAKELDNKLISRFITLERGSPYRQEKIQKQHQSLTASGYFDQVMIQPQPDRESKLVDLDIDLVVRKRHSYSIGIGAATDTGPRTRIGYENRRLNDAGHRFEAEGQASALGGKLGASYIVPLEDPTKEWLTFSTTFEHVETDTSTRDTFHLGGKLTRTLDDGWLQTAYLDLDHESFEVADDKGEATPLIPGISWQHTEKDNPQRIRHGHRLELDLSGAPIDFSDGSSFLQTKASGSLIRSPTKSGRLLLRADLGATWAEDQDKMPVSRRFFAGGDNSVRGYEYQSLGPKNASGEVEGGAFLLVGSMEYEQFIDDAWSVAGFVDSGNAFDDELDKLYTGVGVGVRWQSPVGPVRFDVANPLDGNDDFRLHIGIGPRF